MKNFQNRRDFLKNSIAGISSLAFFGPSLAEAISSSAGNRKKTNVILILTDDLGWNDVGCYGQGRIKTPNIDKLARQGMRFTNAHAPTSICTPSRFALLTGKYCWRTSLKKGVIGHKPLLIEPGSITLPSIFKQCGYQTACIGKWHLGMRDKSTGKFDPDTHYVPPIKPGPNDIGFDYFFGLPIGHFYPPGIYMENDSIYKYDPNDPLVLAKSKEELEHGAEAARYKKDQVIGDLTKKAVEYISKNKDEQFFLYFAPSSPHDPYAPSQKFKGKSKLGDYGDFVMETDWAVGEIIKSLEKNKIDDETLIIFTSDNGGENAANAALKEYNYNPNGKWRGDKGDIYEGALRIPFIARWPGVIKAGQKNDQLLGFNDMLATFAAMLGRDIPSVAGPDSYNVFDTFKGKQNLYPERGLILHSRGGLYAIIEGDWKYIHGQGNGERVKGGYPAPDQPAQGQLFDLKNDPYESADMYSQRPEIVNKLQNLLKEYYVNGKSR
ncbi:MAG: arylsulfatase [Phycisphaerae bacterium]|jgi:arylsulfatase A-like enzyme